MRRSMTLTPDDFQVGLHVVTPDGEGAVLYPMIRDREQWFVMVGEIEGQYYKVEDLHRVGDEE